MELLHRALWKIKTEPQWILSARLVLCLASTGPHSMWWCGFVVYPDVARQRLSYLKLRQQSRKTFLGKVAPAHTLKITLFSVRVGSMGSMEARGRLSLPHWGKWPDGRWGDCTLAPDYNLHNRGRAQRARESENASGTAATRDLPWAGKDCVLKPPVKL